MKKTAIILFNLGGPDRPENVKPFLLNLFNDPAILRVPAFLRRPAARFITARRERTAANIYAKIGGRSPILENTELQAAALEKEFTDNGTRCFISMRYWHPFADETARAVKDFTPDEIILLPLYPQFSTTTTASSLKSWHEAAQVVGLAAPTKIICCYPDEPGFIEVLAQTTRAVYEEAKSHGKPRVLFSAHGLPEKIVRSGDPYQFQCGRTAAALVKKLGIEGLDWTLCYQSRVGRLKWIGPSTNAEIERAGRDKAPLVIVPIAFVCENSETLFEIDMLYRELAMRVGVPYFGRVPTVSAAPEFIAGLTRLVRLAQKNSPAEGAISNHRICPPGFSGCCHQGK